MIRLDCGSLRAADLLRWAGSATKIRQVYGLSVVAGLSIQALVARDRSALQLPGGDIFLDLLSPDARFVHPPGLAVKSQLRGGAVPYEAAINQTLVARC
jgi:hypothetical protein